MEELNQFQGKSPAELQDMGITLNKMLDTVTDVFNSYAEQHIAKGTVEGREKAARNAAVAEMLELVFKPLLEDLQSEVTYWRQEAYATAWSAAVRLKTARENGDDKATSLIFVNEISPRLAAIAGAQAKEWHTACLACGLPLLSGQQAVIWADGDRSHSCCDDTSKVYPEGHPDMVYEGQNMPLEIYDDGYSAAEMARMLSFAEGEAAAYSNPPSAPEWKS